MSETGKLAYFKVGECRSSAVGNGEMEGQSRLGGLSKGPSLRTTCPPPRPTAFLLPSPESTPTSPIAMAPRNQVSKKVSAAKGKPAASEAKRGPKKTVSFTAKKTKSKPIRQEENSDSEDLEMRMPSDSEGESSEDTPKGKKVYGIRSC